MKNIFIIGSKGIPAKYGGFETFVDFLTNKKINKEIMYHVSCLGSSRNVYYHNNARCFTVKVPKLGSASAVLYDLLSLIECMNYIKKNKLKDCIIYILACRIGPFFFCFTHQLKKLGIKVYVNPDGQEWNRSKWNKMIKLYWKISEKLMIKYADLIICDSKGIETHIKKKYKIYNPKTKYIAYGAELEKSPLTDNNPKVVEWYQKHKIYFNNYYLIVGRFVPENNYELIINEFIKSKSTKDLVIISNIEENKFYSELVSRTKFINDKRIKFVGTVYDKELIKKIREKAYCYLHGHEVGGTNPSLLEALASTNFNLLLNVIFNKEVGKEGALYFTKEEGSLANLINTIENFSTRKFINIGNKAKNRIKQNYSWGKIIKDYENLFMR
ncbi:beta 1-4 rhamnosyltransferase Cps2T [Bacillus sp. FJAT-27445]|uniref:beta 1-4 rhamnosyltransferase Cps2T n=1 Tax=Bacillus sp. FJAT-27445 TaxID=1679166 RepID=UPI0007437C36|nr:DUF1972 domain-containing protein [Bacillus sp. FJAT-27445]